MVCDYCQGRESLSPSKAYMRVSESFSFSFTGVPYHVRWLSYIRYVRLACVVRRVFDNSAIVEHDAT